MSNSVNGVPDPPVIESANGGNHSIRIVYSDPIWTGGTPIIGYVYEISDPDGNQQTITSDITGTGNYIFSGLTNGTLYSIRMQAINDAGNSATSNTITSIPFTNPDVPVIMNIIPGNHSAIVEASANVFNGGSPITGYSYSVNGGFYYVADFSGTRIFITNDLPNGYLASVLIKSANIAGESFASDPYDVIPYTVPDAPVITASQSVSYLHQLRMFFSFPPSDGGSVITYYKYSIDPPGLEYHLITDPIDPITPFFTIPGVIENATYSIRLLAGNQAGDGTPSGPFTTIAYASPHSPVITRVIQGNASITVSFQPGENDIVPVLSYQYWVYPVDNSEGTYFTDTGSLDTTFTITGLTNGGQYGLQLRALNQYGASKPTDTIYVSPFTVPSPPSITSILAKNFEATIHILPGDNGGRPIVRFEYSLNGEPYVSFGSSTLHLTHLNNYNTYTIQLVAYNEGGASDPSPTYQFTPYYSQVDVPFIKRKNTANNSLTKSQHYALNVAIDKGKTRIVKR